MKYTHKNSGTCSTSVSFELDGDGCVRDVSFTGGCNGNLKAIARLVEGMDARRVAELLAGNKCGFKNTSCADQLALALKEATAAPASEEATDR